MRTPHRPKALFRYSPLIAALACVLAPQAAAGAPYTVDSGNGSGAGTLFSAISQANAACTGTDTIDFSAPFTVTISTHLPDITCNGLTITGNSGGTSIVPNAGFVYGSNSCGGGNAAINVVATGVKIVNLDISGFNTFGVDTPGFVALCGRVHAKGNHLHGNGEGIRFELGFGDADSNFIYSNDTGINVVYGGATITNNLIGTSDGFNPQGNNSDGVILGGLFPSAVSGNTISDNFNGIYVSDAGGSTISGNKIGTNPSGTAGLGSQSDGILSFSNPTISGNTISNNTWGIELYNTGTVTGNKIGTDITGSAAIPNDIGFYGGSLQPSVSINGNNTISGNTSAGIAIAYNSSGGTISGNKIGTNAGGTGGIGNGTGIVVSCSSGVQVADNVISGNGKAGVWFSGASNGQINSNNRIGISIEGLPLGNAGDGVLLEGSACNGSLPLSAPLSGKRLGKSRTKVFGPTESSNNRVSDNHIAHNGGAGVQVRTNPGGSSSNPITGNRIYANAKNIDLLGDVTLPLLNDPGDPDSGANHGQNYPLIDTVTHVGSQTTVNFTLDTAPGSYFVEVFSNPGPNNPGGFQPEGGEVVAVSNAPAVTSITLDGTFDNVSLTATLVNVDNTPIETSEFSPMVALVAAPAVNVFPLSVPFGAVPVGQASSPRTITLTSTGGAPWVLNELSSNSCDSGVMCSGSEYMCSTNCVPGSPYARGTSCTVTAIFAPTFLGTQDTHIQVCDNTGTTQDIELTGTGVTPPPISITPFQWDFGGVLVGQESAPQTFVVINPGSTPVPIGPVSTLGDFRLMATNCGTSIPGPGECTADVVFHPTQPGLATGFLIVPTTLITDGAPAPKVAKVTLPSAASLYGTGVQQAQLDVPAVIEFGVQVVGSPAITRTATVRNTGNAFLTLTSITVSGAHFTMSHDCPLNLAPGATCTLTLNFSSNVVGDFAGLVSIASNAGGGLRTISLGGLAQLVPKPVITVNPRSMGFGDRVIGTTSPTQRVTINNEGGAPATLGTLTTTIDYLIVNTTCGIALAPQSTCFADVAMRPVGFGSRVGEFSFTSNADGSPHKVTLDGAGCRPFTTSSNRLGTRSNCSP